MVENALKIKKEKEAEEILLAFKKSVFEYRQNKTKGDAMFLNTALLINSEREKEIDSIVADLGEKYKGRTDFTYTGPLPVYNFINLKIFPERWEM